MADIGDDDDIQLQGKELFKQQFKQNFTTNLTRILAFDPNTLVSENRVIEILDRLNQVAIMYGKSYIAKDVSEYNDCSAHIGYGVPPIGQEKCFMQLLRECDPQSEEGRKLWNLKHRSGLVGERISLHLLRMMVVMNTENKKNLMNKFRDIVHLFPFLVDVFEWPRRSDDFGVVYNRIIFLLEHARKDFILQVERSRMPAGSMGYVTDAFINFDNKRERDEYLDGLLIEIVLVISKLECLLSFPLLPDGPRLLTSNITSLAWLREELVDMETNMPTKIGNSVKHLVEIYKGYNNDTAEFLLRMVLPRREMWEDLESVVREVKGPGSKRRVRLHVRGTIRQQNPNSLLIQIVGINTREEAEWCTGKHIVYFYRTKRTRVKKNGSHYHCIWGKVTRSQGNHGILRAKFKSNLPPKCRRARVRVYMYRAKFNSRFPRAFV